MSDATRALDEAWVARLRGWAREAGFGSLGVADIDLRDAEPGLLAWLAAGCHGEMDYMARHGLRRARPAELVPGTVSALMVTADYAPAELAAAMLHSHYPLQALLYSVVVHRYLRWRLPDYAPERHLGGVLYLYLRGMCGPDSPIVDGHPSGVFSWSPPAALIVEVSELLAGEGPR